MKPPILKVGDAIHFGYPCRVVSSVYGTLYVSGKGKPIEGIGFISIEAA